MTRLRRLHVQVLAGFVSVIAWAPAQDYTLSAKPGVVNYVEGDAYLNGAQFLNQTTKAASLQANDSFSTGTGKAEILLAPGAFLRIGDNSEIRMIAPGLTDTQVEVIRGEAMLEIAGLVKGSDVLIVNHGATIRVMKNGLYRFTGGNPATAAVLAGEAQVGFGGREVALKQGREALFAETVKTQKFDTKQEDELYAWSNIRSQYEAAASYQAASLAAQNAVGSRSSGWYFDSAFGCWAWLPGSGAFFSPFGWGFYSPGAVGYAPVVSTGVARGGHWVKDRDGDRDGDKDKDGDADKDHKGDGSQHWEGMGTTASVPINTKHPPAVGVLAASPAQESTLRKEAAQVQSFARPGFGTQNGARAAGSSAGRAAGFSDLRAARADANSMRASSGGSRSEIGGSAGRVRTAGSGNFGRGPASGGFSRGAASSGFSGGAGRGGFSSAMSPGSAGHSSGAGAGAASHAGGGTGRH